MRRQLIGLLVVCLCAISPLVAQTVQFSAEQDIQTNSTHLTGLAVADFNGDKKLDIAVTDAYSQTVSVYLNDGTGKFGPPVTSTFTVPSIGGFGLIVAGDVNEDGKQDLIVGPIAGLQYDVVLIGNGDGTFTEKDQIPNSYSFVSAALTDISGDKHLDLIGGGNGSLYVHLGDGHGNFTAKPPMGYPSGDLYPSIAVGDFNSDKVLDFVALSLRANQLLYFPGNGDGTFRSASITTLPVLGSLNGLVAADFNGDSRLDLLVSSNDAASLIYGNGDGTFQTGNIDFLPLPIVTYVRGTQDIPVIAAADMNGDGKVDVVAADSGSHTLNVLLNDGTGKFSLPFSVPVADGVADLKVADFNGDSVPDIVAINYKTQKISLFLALPQLTTPNISIQSSATQALIGTPITITVQVTPSSAHVPTGFVTLASGTTSYGQQTLNSTGQASFTLPLLGVGQYPLTASYTGDAYNNSASNTSTIVQESTDFQFSQPSYTQAIGIGAAATYNLTLTPQAGFTGPVTFSCSGVPTGYACSAPSVSVNAQAVNVAVVVSPPVAISRSRFNDLLFHSSTAMLLTCSSICWYSRRRRIGQLFLCILGLAVLGAGLGCSSVSALKPAGYKGTTHFIITASTTQNGVTVSHQVPATLTVQ